MQPAKDHSLHSFHHRIFSCTVEGKPPFTLDITQDAIDNLMADVDRQLPPEKREVRVIENVIEKISRENIKAPKNKPVYASLEEGNIVLQSSPKHKAAAFGTAEIQGNRNQSKITVQETTQHRAMLECMRLLPLFTGPLASIQKILHPVFTRLGEKFKRIEHWWSGIVGLQHIQMPWSLSSLSAACRSVLEDKEPTLTQSMHYISSITRELNPKISASLHRGAKWGEQLDKIRSSKKCKKGGDKFANKYADQLTAKILTTIKKMPDKHFGDTCFVSLSDGGSEAMLGISKTEDNQFRVRIVQNLDGQSDILLRNMTGDDLKSFLKENVKACLEQTPLKISGFAYKEVEQTAVTVGNLGSVISMIAMKQSSEQDEYLDLALRLRSFLDICNATRDQWLEDPDFNGEIRRKCSQLLFEFDRIKKEKMSPFHIEQEFKGLFKAIGEVLGTAETAALNVRSVDQVKLDPVGSKKFPQTTPPKNIGSTKAKHLVPDNSISDACKKTFKDCLDTLQDSSTYQSEVSIELSKELKGSVSYSGSHGGVGHIIEWRIPDPDHLRSAFPALTKLNLSREEGLSLVYTLYSEMKNEFREGAKQARAHYTFQAIVNNPLMGRSQEAQSWIRHQLFSKPFGERENRLDLFLQTASGKEALQTYLKTMVEKGVDLLNTRTTDANPANKWASAIFLLTLTQEISAYADKAGKPFALDEDGSQKLDGLEIYIRTYAGGSDSTSQAVQDTLFPGFLVHTGNTLLSSKNPEKELEKYSDHKIAALLNAFACCRSRGTISGGTKCKIDALESVIYRHLKDRTEERTKHIITGFLQTYGHAEYDKCKWDTRKLPIVTSRTEQGQDISVDLTTGDIFTNNYCAGRLVHQVADHPDVRRLLPEGDALLWNIETVRDNPNITVYRHPTKTIRIIAEKIPGAKKDDGTSSATFNCRIEQQFPDSLAWAVYTYFPSQEAMMKGAEVRDSPGDLPPDVAAIVENRDCWWDFSKNHIHIRERDGIEDFAVFTPTELRLAKSAQLLSPKPESFRQFTPFETTRGLIVYGKDGSANRVEYPRLKMAKSQERLAYEIAGDKIVCPLFANWTLSPFGKLPGLSPQMALEAGIPTALPIGFTAFQLLEKEGKQKVLLAGRELKSKETDTSMRGAYKTQSTPKSGFAASNVYEYTLDSDSNRLVSSNPSANLQLAYISFVHKDYGQMLHYMEKTRSACIDDPQSIQEIMGWVKNWNDESPNGIAAKLNLLCLIEEMQQRIDLQFKGMNLMAKVRSEKACDEARLTIQELHRKYREKSVDTYLLLSSSTKQLMVSLGIAITDHSDVASLIMEAEKGLQPIKEPVQHAPKAYRSKPILLQEPGGDGVKGCFHFIKGATRDITSKLKMFDPVPGEEPNVSRVKQLHLEDTRAAIAQGQSKGNTMATLKLGSAKDALERTKTIRNVMIKDQNVLIEDLIVQVSKKPEEKGVFTSRAKRFLGRQKTISVDALVQMWNSGTVFTPKEFRKYGAYLTQQQCQKLENDVMDYMLASADIAHLDRIVEAFSDAIKSGRLPDSEQLPQDVCANIYSLVETRRAYSTEDPACRLFLSIEYAKKSILRENQVTTLRAMLNEPNGVHQLGMGGGKTEYLLPLLAKGKANGTNLVGILLDNNLYESQRRNLDATNRALFGQTYYCFEYTRSSSYTSKDYDQIYLNFLNTIHSKGFFASTPNFIRGFRDAYISKVTDLHDGNYKDLNEKIELTKQVQSMAKICLCLRKHCQIVGDEFDTVMDVRKEVNFAQGKPGHVDPVKTKIGHCIMEIVAKAEGRSPLVRLKKALNDNTQADIPPEQRKKDLENIVKIYFQEHPIAGCTEKDFVAYICGENDAARPTFMSALQLQDPDQYKKIASLKDFMNRGFNITFGLTRLVDYGRPPADGEYADSPFTIPYKGSGRAVIGSEFDDDIERISYSLQDYFAQNVRKGTVSSCLAGLLKEMDEEYKDANKKGLLIKRKKFQYSDTNAYKTFTKMVESIDPPKEDGSYVVPRDLLAYTSPHLVTKFTAMINASPKNRLAFCKYNTLDRQMLIYPSQVSSKAEDLADMVLSIGGFTGTPWNPDTFHKKITTTRNKGVDGNTYALLLRKNPPVKIIEYNPHDPTESLVKTGHNIYIDTGALLRGVENKDFMSRLMSERQRNTPHGIGMYLDSSDKVVYRKHDGTTIDQLPKEYLEERLALFDQVHTVGVDFKFAPKAVAAVTIGTNTSIRDLFQAVWRLRQLDLEQNIEFVITKEMRHLIMGDDPNNPTVKDILLYCLKQEALREADDNYRGEVTRITGLAPRAMFDLLVEAGITVQAANLENSQLMKLSKVFTPHLIKKRKGEEAFEQAAAALIAEPPQKVLKKLITEKAAALKTEIDHHASLFASSPAAQARLNQATNDLNNYKVIDSDKMMKEVRGIPDGGAQVEAQVEQMVTSFTLSQTEHIEAIVTAAPVSVSRAPGELKMESDIIEDTHLIRLCNTEEDQLTKEMSGRSAMVNVRNMIGAFDSRIFVGNLYDGRLKTMYPDSSVSTGNNFEQIDRTKSIVSMETNQAKVNKASEILLQTQRLPISEALFMRGPKGWRAVFGNLCDTNSHCYKFAGLHEDIAAGLVMINEGNFTISEQNMMFARAKRDDEFMDLYVQIKLLSGKTNFSSDDEIDALKRWAKKIGGMEKLRKLYEFGIRPCCSAEVQRAYMDSTLYDLFESEKEAEKEAEKAKANTVRLYR